jgi:outer membrane protein assembly factor BamB
MTLPTGGTVASSPTLGADGTLYVGADRHNVLVIAPTGQVIRELPTDGRIRGRDHIIYFGAVDKALHAVDAAGTPKWTFLTGGAVNSSAAVSGDGTVFFGSEDKKLCAVAPDGTLVWSFATEGPIDSSPAIGPAGEIVVGSRDGSVYCFR